MKISYGLNESLGVIRDVITLRINGAGENRQVAVFASKRLLIVWDRRKPQM